MFIISIEIGKREKEVPEVQEVLTKYGDDIHTRIGMHNLKEKKEGLIVIAYEGNKKEKFIEDLNLVNDATINYMEV